jgi:hypothetical protein
MTGGNSTPMHPISRPPRAPALPCKGRDSPSCGPSP